MSQEENDRALMQLRQLCEAKNKISRLREIVGSKVGDIRLIGSRGAVEVHVQVDGV